MPHQLSIETLDTDGRAELLARDFPMEPQGGRVIDVEREREMFSTHSWCEGCIACFDPILDAEI